MAAWLDFPESIFLAFHGMSYNVATIAFLASWTIKIVFTIFPS
jgi:hypothetical protein